MHPPPGMQIRLPDLLSGSSKQSVHDGRFADSGRTKESNRLPAAGVAEDLVQSAAIHCADRKHGDSRGQRHRFRQTDRDIDAGIRLVQYYYRAGAALPGNGEIALNPAWIEIGIQPAYQAYGIDVGGNHLRADRCAGLFPEERCPARQEKSYYSPVTAFGIVCQHPVPAGRQAYRIGRFIPERTCRFRP